MKNFDLQRVDVRVLLEEIGIRNVDSATEEEMTFSCPFPGHSSGDEKPSAYMNTESTAWFCHGCKRRGNAITFLADLYNFSNNVSVGFLIDRFGGGFQSPDTTLEDEIDEFFMEQGKPDQEPINYVLQKSTLSDFCLNDAASEYMQDRGFRQSTLEEWQIGYDRKSERITIPIFDELGRLVGFKGRALGSSIHPKYKVLGGPGYGFPHYHVGLVLFGADKVPEGVKGAILVEGEFNCMAMHQMGWKQTIALGGSTFTETHARKIKQQFEGCTLFLDSDKAGNTATAEAIRLLQLHMPLWVVPEHDLDPADVLQKLTTPGEQKRYMHLILSERVGTLSVMVDA